MGQVATRAEVFAEIEQVFGLVPEWIRSMPDVALASFWGLMRDFYLAETTIPLKYKELIGLAVAGATRCRYCQLFHVEGARLAGATEEEIAEASMMAGVAMLASTYINAQGVDWNEFRTETLEIVDYARRQQEAVAAQAAEASPPQAH